jgi:hypothetical protein
MEARGLRRALIQARIKQRYKNVAALATVLGVDRSTVGRWLDPGVPTFPRDERTFMRLAAALDMDPVLLWDYDETSFPGLCDRVLRAFSSQTWSGFLESLAFLRRYVVPRTAWPPHEVADLYTGKAWHEFRFCHAPRLGCDFYAKLTISAQGPMDQVWHFAFRDAGTLRSPFWWHYGFVWKSSNALRLFAFHGTTMQVPCQPDSAVVCIETWFGRGAAEFCVASLHPFEAMLADVLPDGTPSVRFGFAGELRGGDAPDSQRSDTL